MTVTIRPATLADATAIRLRPSDLHEALLWAPGWSAQKVMRSSIEHATEAIAAEVGGRVVAIAGYSVAGHEVHPWLLCATESRNHRKFMLRYARAMLSYLRDLYPQALICNHVHRPNTEARGFISHLGFRIVPSPGQAEFDFFYIPPCA